MYNSQLLATHKKLLDIQRSRKMLPQQVEKSQNRIGLRNAELIEYYAQGFKKEH